MVPLIASALFLISHLNTPAGIQVKPDYKNILSQRVMSLDDRYPVPSVSEVFKENILLNMAYLDGNVKDVKSLDWQEVNNPFQYTFTLKPKETFAFHDGVLPEYQGKVVKTTNAHFNSQEGFKTDGYLYGDGVCHLASLINWAAKDAGLDVLAPTRHDFANIPDVPKEYGVSIYNTPGGGSTNTAQNLYITNNQNRDISFVFDYSNDKLSVAVESN